ncbi:fumarate reductase/succinate dehydrogenase flavoprotein subunit, partial [bacterium]|nr:fumarate reductase/succinate dehydrogenase flavoprotein subunit [bacterium]
IPGLFVLGEANFSVHGANRLGASALMQGLADGYFVIPYTIGGYLASIKPYGTSTDFSEFKESVDEVNNNVNKLLSVNGKQTVARSKESLETNLKKIPALREEFWENVKVSGTGAEFNQQLENAGRTADFFEFAELMCRDALHRNESCGGHFRTEFQTDDGEAMRDDANYCYAAAWEFKGLNNEPEMHKEPLKFENVHLAVRSYK